jgi:predicted HTH transcriptional regulator
MGDRLMLFDEERALEAHSNWAKGKVHIKLTDEPPSDKDLAAEKKRQYNRERHERTAAYAKEHGISQAAAKKLMPRLKEPGERVADAKTMQEAADRVRSDRSLTQTSAMILMLLENSGPQTTRQISDAMRMDHKYMGRLMRQMWDKKRVTQIFAGTTSYWRVRK